MNWTFSLSDLAIVFATLIGPILAVQAQKWLERRKEPKDRQLWIFRTLMATRGNTLSPAHVEALNAVPLEFYGKSRRLKAIVDAWRLLIEHFYTQRESQEAWHNRREELLVDMLSMMADHLGYEFGKAAIKREI